MSEAWADNVVPLRASEAAAISDEEIKEIASQNRRRAFDLIVRKYRERLFQQALYMLKDAQEAFDVTQETLIRAYQEQNFFAEDFRMRPWLFRVLSNLCFNITRDRKRRGGILKLMARPVKTDSMLALDEMLKREDENSVAKALSNVPDKYRTILLLKYYNDLSYIEISEVLGCKLGTVMSRLSRAREKLQRQIEAE